MITAPSASFRRSCLALALLTVTWSLPGGVWADSYPLQNVKNVFDRTKPNVLIVLETAQSMQGLPGENPARYNEVGADCEDGNRFCRLVNQSGRWAFSGMGSNGMFFGNVPPSCTGTQSYTDTGITDTVTSGLTDTMTSTTVTVTTSASGLQTGTGSGTGSSIVTGTGTVNATATGTHTGETSGVWTVTASTTETASATKTAASSTAPAASQEVEGTASVTVSTTSTETGTIKLTGTVTVAETRTLTGTVTGTATVTPSLTRTLTGTNTQSQTVTLSGTVSSTGNVTVTGMATATGTVSGTYTGTVVGGGTGSGTGTGTGSGTVTASQITSHTAAGTASKSLQATALITNTVSATGINPVQGTATTTGTVTASSTRTVTASATASVLGGGGGAIHTLTYSATATQNAAWAMWYNNPWLVTQTQVSTSTGSSTQTFTFVESTHARGTNTDISAGTIPTAATGTDLFGSGATQAKSGGLSWTSTMSYASAAVRTGTFTCLPGDRTQVCTSAANVTNTSKSGQLNFWTTFTGTLSDPIVAGTACATVTGTSTVTLNGNVTGVATASGTATVTASGSATGHTTVTASDTVTGVVTASGSMTNTTVTANGQITGTITGTGTGAQPTSTWTTTTTSVTTSGTATQTYTQTLTRTVSTCGFSGNEDPTRCDVSPSTPTTAGFCYESDGASCSYDSACSSVSGDFCQRIDSGDGTGHTLPEPCKVASPSSPSSWGKCKHGTKTENVGCDGYNDTIHCSDVGQDFCAEGEAPRMCSDSGLWCLPGGGNCPGGTSDQCVPATSRMMTVKRALRRAIGDHADYVNFGFANTYQGKGVNATDTDASTAIFPYVQVSCTGPTVTETRLVTRGELEKGIDSLTDGKPCFSLTTGPTDTCYIDYGGNDAINGTGYLNRIAYNKTYGLAGTGDSRWVIPRGDGSGHYNGKEANWAGTCASSPIRPACGFGTEGTGLYEGSYYSFTYTKGTPLYTSGAGSLSQPVYFTTYKGKFYSDGGNCYNAIDAERTEIVNDGVYGRGPYTLESWVSSPYTTKTTTDTATFTVVDTTRERTIPVAWSGGDSGNACSAKNGVSTNQQLVPLLNATTFNGKSVDNAQKALMISGRLDKASFGGVYATGETAALGCALSGETVSYWNTVRGSADQAGACWTNNIVLVVDGHSNGPGDLNANTIDCASDECNVALNTTFPTGCSCSAILNARSLAAGGITTHVVVNLPSESGTRTAWDYTYKFLVSLAKAGSKDGSGVPSFGTTEEELYRGIADKIAAAAYPFTYTTTTPVAGATTQDPTTMITTSSTLLFDAGASYPSWRGTVRAFETSPTLELKWDAASVAANAAALHPDDEQAWWKKRRVFFSDRSGDVERIRISASNGAVENASALFIAGLGASATEAEHIVQWLLGKPGLGNPAPLMGSPTASTPIVVGQAAANGLSGAAFYSAATWQRPQLLYVGADDGMLHAFFAHVGDKELNGVHYLGGEEAFAFIPNDMLPVITKLYTQTRQNLAPNRDQHVFGLAGSPKVKDMCFGVGCETSTGAGWRTVLVMTQGLGGNNPFALDITGVIDETTGLHPEAMTLLWSTAPKTGDDTAVKLPDANHAQTWEYNIGETTSLPGFYFAGYPGGVPQNRLIFASGYPTKPRTGLYADQGRMIVEVDAQYGNVIGSPYSTTPQLDCNSNGYLQDRVLLGDVALARNHSSEATSQLLLGAYVGDTWGNAYQFVPNASPPVSRLYSLGCDQPIYFAPAVVQLDRLQKVLTSAKGIIYLAQVSGSSLDRYSAQFSTGSQIVVSKLDANVTPPIMVPYTQTNSQIILSTGEDNAVNRICYQNAGAFNGTGKTKDQSCEAAGGLPLPTSARPVGTPTAVLRSDGLGFQILTSWYDGDLEIGCSGGSYQYGTSYLTVHEFGVDGTWYQIAGLKLNNTVLTGVAFVGTGLFIDGINMPAFNPGTAAIGETFQKTQQTTSSSLQERYTRTTWSERLDL